MAGRSLSFSVRHLVMRVDAACQCKSVSILWSFAHWFRLHPRAHAPNQGQTYASLSRSLASVCVCVCVCVCVRACVHLCVNPAINTALPSTVLPKAWDSSDSRSDWCTPPPGGAVLRSVAHTRCPHPPPPSAISRR